VRQHLLDVNSLKEDICYNPKTGCFTLRKDLNPRAKASKQIGYLYNKGYVRVPYKGLKLSGHKLAWALFYGEWPKEDIDHINMDRSDNRIDNLRLANKSQNAMNRKALTGKSCGVSFHKTSGKFQARITVCGQTKYLGLFKTENEAAEEYNKFARELHGKFARLNE